MIPYDDLVAALNNWRAKQGLPVSTMGGGSGPTPVATTANPGSGPRTAPPARGKPVSVPPPVGVAEEVDDAAMLDEEDASYDNQGNDFAMSFGGQPAPAADDPTAIGEAPERPSERTNPVGRGGAGKRSSNDEW